MTSGSSSLKRLGFLMISNIRPGRVKCATLPPDGRCLDFCCPVLGKSDVGLFVPINKLFLSLTLTVTYGDSIQAFTITPGESCCHFGSPDNGRIRVRSPPDGDGVGDPAALAGVRDDSGRVKCATLLWHALRSGIEGR